MSEIIAYKDQNNEYFDLEIKIFFILIFLGIFFTHSSIFLKKQLLEPV